MLQRTPLSQVRVAAKGSRVMRRRTRKLVGTIVMMIFVVIYALLVMVLAQPILRDASHLVQGLFYLVAGLAWVLPIMPLIKWMDKPDLPAA
jgi:hypothetical protein